MQFVNHSNHISSAKYPDVAGGYPTGQCSYRIFSGETSVPSAAMAGTLGSPGVLLGMLLTTPSSVSRGG